MRFHSSRLAVGVMLTVAGSAFATVFPDVGGSHDIASESAWNGEIPSAAEFNAGGTYGAGKDVTFGSILLSGGNNVFDLRESAATVTITNSPFSAENKKISSTRNTLCLNSGANDTVQSFRGGRWYLPSGYLGLGIYGVSTGSKGAQMIFSDGAVVDDVGSLCVAGPYANPDGSVLTFTGAGTKLSLRKEAALLSTAFLIGNVGSKSDVKGRLEILDGAELTSGTALYFDTGSEVGKPHPVDLELRVSGPGSKATFDGAIYMGWGWNVGNRIVFDDHATGSFNTFCIGYGSNLSPAVSNVVTIKNGAAVTAKANISLAQTPAQSAVGHSYGNRLEVLSGARLTADSKKININHGSASTDAGKTYNDGKYDLGDGTHDNGVIVSNATVALGTSSGYATITVGEGNYTYNGFLKILDGSTVTNSEIYVGLGATNAFNTAEIRDSEVYTAALYVGNGSSSRSNSVDVSGSRLVNTRYLYAGNGVGSYGNRIRISDTVDSYTANYDLTVRAGGGVGACDNGVQISNATFACSTPYLYVPHTGATNGCGNALSLEDVSISATSGNACLLIGDAPGARGNSAYFRKTVLPSVPNLWIGGTNSSATFVDTPVTVTSTFSGRGSMGPSRGAKIAFRGRESVLSVPGNWSYNWGAESGSCTVDDAELSIEDGAELKLKSTETMVYVGQADNSGNKLRIDNGKLTCKFVQLYGNGSEFTASGADTRLTLSQTQKTYGIFGDGPASNCTFRLTDGAKLYPTSWNLYFCFSDVDSHDNTIVVEKNALLDLAECKDDKGNSSRQILLGYWGAVQTKGLVRGNTLLVQSGGVITNAMQIYIGYTSHNRLIIDGGEVHCTSVSDGANNGTDESVIIRGKGSKLRFSSTFHRYASQQDTVRFEVPEGGYDETPIKGTDFILDAGTKLEIDVSALLAGLKDGEQALHMNLVEATGTLSFGEGVLEAAVARVNEQLAAAECSGRLSVVGKTLTLKAGKKKGLIFVVR